jgi:hypothetical protein
MVTEDQLFGDLRAGTVRLGRFENVHTVRQCFRDFSSEDNTVKTYLRGPLFKEEKLNPLGASEGGPLSKGRH